MKHLALLGIGLILGAQAFAQIANPWQQQFALTPSPDRTPSYVFYIGTNAGSPLVRVALTNASWTTATNELTIGLAKTNLVGGVTNFVTATAMDLNGVESEPCPEINFVPPRPPGTIRLSTTVMRSDNPLGPWTVVTNLQTIELAADANQGFYRSRMDVK